MVIFSVCNWNHHVLHYTNPLPATEVYTRQMKVYFLWCLSECANRSLFFSSQHGLKSRAPCMTHRCGWRTLSYRPIRDLRNSSVSELLTLNYSKYVVPIDPFPTVYICHRIKNGPFCEVNWNHYFFQYIYLLPDIGQINVYCFCRKNIFWSSIFAKCTRCFLYFFDSLASRTDLPRWHPCECRKLYYTAEEWLE